MAVETTLAINGDKELRRKLLRVKNRIADKAIRAGLRQGASIIARQARSLAPIGDSGRLRDSLKVSNAVKVQKRKGELMAIIGPGTRNAAIKNVNGKLVDPTVYGMWVEFGTVKTKAKPFLRPAWESKKTDAINAIRKKAREVLEKEARKR